MSFFTERSVLLLDLSMLTLWSSWLERLVSYSHTSCHLIENPCRLLSSPFSRSSPLPYRLFGALELPGRSPIMRITTREAGKVDKKTICRDKKLDEVQWSIFRAHHGGWKVHTSKPPTMPDNANYPKKVWVTSQLTLILHTLWNQYIALSIYIRTHAGRRLPMITMTWASRCEETLEINRSWNISD